MWRLQRPVVLRNVHDSVCSVCCITIACMYI